MILRASVAGFALAVSIVGSNQALAQAEDGGESPIIVTARRLEERLQDVPISITVFDQEQLDKRNIVNPMDLATYTPSLSTYQRFGPEKGFFLLRGFTQENSTAPSVGVYFADVAAPRGGGGTGSGNGAGAGDFFDLQNVQVLKGPQGTLFGRNTTGGAVLLTPRKPTSRLEGYIEGSAGNYDMWRVQGVLNVPLADTFHVRLGIDRQTRRGYMHNHSGIGPEYYNNVDYTAMRLGVLADLTPDLENYMLFRYSNSDTNGYAGRITLCNPLVTTGRAALTAPAACAQIARQNARGDGLLDVEINNPNGFQKIRQWQAINTTTWRASDTLTIKNIVSYAEFRERASFGLGGDNFTLAPPMVPAGSPLIGTRFMYATISPRGSQDNSRQSTFVEELQFQGQSADGKLSWQAGAYLEVSRPLGFSVGYTANLLNCIDISAAHCFNPLGAAGSLTQPMTKDYFNNKGVYAQGTYKFSDLFAVTAGIRYSIDHMRGVGQTTRILFDAAGNQTGRVCFDTFRFQGPPVNGNPTPLPVIDPAQCRNEIRIKSEKPTWLIDLEFTPTDDLLFYAKYARGYRQGGMFFNNIGLETWQPEKVDTYEIGSKASFHGTVSGNFNIAAFYNDFRNQQLAANLVGRANSGVVGALGIVNAGKSRIWGVEAEGSLLPVEGLRLDFGYSYLNTKLISITPPTLPDTSPYALILPGANAGADLNYAPHNKFTVTGTYRLPLSSDIGEISLGATYAHTGAQNAATPQTSPLYRLPATDLVNLNLDWKGVAALPVDIAVFVTNLTDKRYPVSIGAQYASAGYELIQVGPPRMWGLRLRYNFGE